MHDRLEQIIEKRNKMIALAKVMTDDGVNALAVTHEISRITDAILNTLIDIAIEKLGPPPADFAFMVMGSEGRMEQTLKTDQDNAIVYKDPEEGDAQQMGAYFLALGDKVCSWLDTVGYSLCKGEVMASNPQWCQPLSKWKSYFHRWTRRSTETDLLHSAIIFDFRFAYGQHGLVDALKGILFEKLDGWSRFFRDLTLNAQRFRPPISVFNNIVVESKGAHRSKFDLKYAMTPIVDFARIFALHHNIAATNTRQRLSKLHQLDVLDQATLREITRCYAHLMQFRLKCQFEALGAGQAPTNHLNPDQLSPMEQNRLKLIFKHIKRYQLRLKMDFTGGI